MARSGSTKNQEGGGRSSKWAAEHLGIPAYLYLISRNTPATLTPESASPVRCERVKLWAPSYYKKASDATAFTTEQVPDGYGKMIQIDYLELKLAGIRRGC
jgi:hypothetical protein